VLEVRGSNPLGPIERKELSRLLIDAFDVPAKTHTEKD